MLPRKDSSVERGFKVFLDLAALFLAANLSFDLRYYIDWGGWLRSGPAPWGELYQAMPYMMLAWFLIFSIFGLYRSGLRRREEIGLLFKAQGLAFVLLFAAAFFYRGFSFSRAAALTLMPLAFLFTVLLRMGFRVVKEQLLRWHSVQERLLVVGRTAETDGLLRKLRRPDNPYELVGVLVRQPAELQPGIPALGDVSELASVLERETVDRVLLISGDLSHAELMAAIDACLERGVAWAVVPDLYDLLVDRLHLDEVAGIPVMGPHGSTIAGLNLVLKRVVDWSAAALLALAMAPVMGALALLIKLTSRGPVLFVQERLGRFGRPFRLYKFRTMLASADDRLHRQVMEGVIGQSAPPETDGRRPIYKLKHDPRITPVGHWLRRFSLDELPQLFNVLKGDMSLVGPRPAVAYEVAQYRERHRRRLEAPPGITGLWQVSGRNRLSFDEMVELDIKYIENWSLGLDLRILFKTLAAVLFYRGY